MLVLLLCCFFEFLSRANFSKPKYSGLLIHYIEVGCLYSCQGHCIRNEESSDRSFCPLQFAVIVTTRVLETYSKFENQFLSIKITFQFDTISSMVIFNYLFSTWNISHHNIYHIHCPEWHHCRGMPKYERRGSGCIAYSKYTIYCWSQFQFIRTLEISSA